jgi:hypothetical protein
MMPKLNTRQIVILAITVVALLYGGYEFFFAKNKKTAVVDTGKKVEELNAFITEMTVTMGKDTMSPQDAHMIKRAETAWARDPFYERKTEKIWAVTREQAQAAGTVAAPKTHFIYTGYVEAGKKKIAIINGSEYVAGDGLDVEGYVLSGVYPARVTIYNRDTRRKIDIPLQE